MRKRLVLLLCYALVPLLSAQAAQTNATHPNSLQKILQRGEVRIAMDTENNPPFVINDNGKLSGIDYTLAKNLARTLKVKLHLLTNAKKYDDVITEVVKGKADLGISHLSRTPERGISVHFSAPYYTMRLAMIINRLNERALPNTDLANSLNHPSVKIGLFQGTSYDTYAKNDFPKAKIIDFKNETTMLEALAKGEITATLIDEPTMQAWYANQPDLAIHTRPLVIENKIDTLGIAINPEDARLLEWVNLYLESIQNDGTLARVISEFLPSAAT